MQDIKEIQKDKEEKKHEELKKVSKYDRKQLMPFILAAICLIGFLVILSLAIPKVVSSRKAASLSENKMAVASASENEEKRDKPPVDISPGIMNAITGEFTTEDGKRFRFRPDGIFSGYISQDTPNAAGVYIVCSTTGDGPGQDILTVTDGVESASYVMSFSDDGAILLGSGNGEMIFTLRQSKAYGQNAENTPVESTVSEESIENPKKS